MPFSKLRPHRPSASIVIATIALFVSLGGGAYAQFYVPNGSVGTNQIRNEAVTYRKIRPGAVGIVRANTSQLQVRVGQSCGAGSAIGAIDQIGHVTCNQALPAEFGTTDNTATVGSTATTINTVTLPAGPSYLALADPVATVTSSGTPQEVTETCTLTVGSDTQTRSAVVRTDATSGDTVTAEIPLQLAGTSGTSTVSCTSSVASGTLPSISVTSALNAIQTSSNT